MSRTEALADLMQNIFEREESGRSVPCVNPSLSGWWLSEDDEQQQAAVLACSTCPVLRDCRAYVEAWPEDGAVWAGMLPSKRGRRNDRRDALARGDRS